MLDTVSLHIPSGSVRSYSVFTVLYDFKVSPSAICVSAAKAVCRNIDIFNKHCILLTNISQLLKSKTLLALHIKDLWISFEMLGRFS
jgi:hypothetical protein